MDRLPPYDLGAGRAAGTDGIEEAAGADATAADGKLCGAGGTLLVLLCGGAIFGIGGGAYSDVLPDADMENDAGPPGGPPAPAPPANVGGGGMAEFWILRPPRSIPGGSP